MAAAWLGLGWVWVGFGFGFGGFGVRPLNHNKQKGGKHKMCPNVTTMKSWGGLAISLKPADLAPLIWSLKTLEIFQPKS